MVSCDAATSKSTGCAQRLAVGTSSAECSERPPASGHEKLFGIDHRYRRCRARLRMLARGGGVEMAISFTCLCTAGAEQAALLALDVG